MSYTVVLNSKDRANQTENPNNAIYNFDWSALDEGNYKVTWVIQKVIHIKWNIIDPYKQFWYYPLHDDSSNYATGKAVQDATTQNYTTIKNQRMNIIAPAVSPSGIMINNVVPCNINTGFTFSCWFNTSSMPSTNYGFLMTLQDELGFSGGNRFYITLNANRININSQYNSGIISLNTTYHFVLTITNSNQAVVYLNNDATNATITYPSFVNVVNRNYIGSPTNNSMIGWMQECRLYNRVITSTEVATLYNSGYNL